MECDKQYVRGQLVSGAVTGPDEKIQVIRSLQGDERAVAWHSSEYENDPRSHLQEAYGKYLFTAGYVQQVEEKMRHKLNSALDTIEEISRRSGEKIQALKQELAMHEDREEAEARGRTTRRFYNTVSVEEHEALKKEHDLLSEALACAKRENAKLSEKLSLEERERARMGELINQMVADMQKLAEVNKNLSEENRKFSERTRALEERGRVLNVEGDSLDGEGENELPLVAAANGMLGRIAKATEQIAKHLGNSQ